MFVFYLQYQKNEEKESKTNIQDFLFSKKIQTGLFGTKMIKLKDSVSLAC